MIHSLKIVTSFQTVEPELKGLRSSMIPGSDISFEEETSLLAQTGTWSWFGREHSSQRYPKYSRAFLAYKDQTRPWRCSAYHRREKRNQQSLERTQILHFVWVPSA